MNNNHNTSENSNPDEQEDETRHDVGYIDKAINCLSRYFSYVGISLYATIYSGMADMLGYENIHQISDWAQCMIIAAVILFFLALLLSFFKLDPVAMHRTTLRGRMSFKRSKIAKVVGTMDKGIKKYYNKYFKYSKNVSSKAVQAVDKFKQEESDVKNSDMSSEQEENKNSSISLQQPNTSKNGDRTKTVSSNIPSKTIQHSITSSKRTENTRTLTSNSSSQSHLAAGSCEQGISTGILSPNISSENLYRASTPKQGSYEETINTEPRPFSVSKEASYECKELVPYVQQFENPSNEQHVIPKVKESLISSFNNFLSTSAVGNRPAAEIVATKKMTIFPGGLAQEEYTITQKAFYNCMWCPMGVNLDNPLCLGNRRSSESVLGPHQKNPWCPGSNTSEHLLAQNLNNNSFGPVGGIYSQSSPRSNLDNTWNSGPQISPNVQSLNLRSPCYPVNRSSPQSVLNQSFDSSWYTGGTILPQDASKPKFDSASRSSGSGISFKNESDLNLRSRSDQPMGSSLVLHQPVQNQVSNVRTKFESMNI